MSKYQIGFLGAGKMATALAKGLIDSGFTTPNAIFACDVLPTAVEAFSAATGASVAVDTRDVLKKSRILFLAVKPQSMPPLLDELQDQLQPHHLLVSIAAGVTLAHLESVLGNQRIVRVMPNTPCLVGAGASGYSRGTHASTEDADLVGAMLQTVGIALPVPESLLDAVTGLSGSGPAYVFEIIEALSDGGVLMGLPRNIATTLAAQTLLGAARMVLETGDHPGPLKDAVTSPGGTTIAGLHALEQGGLRATLMNAVQAATLRSRQLARGDN